MENFGMSKKLLQWMIVTSLFLVNFNILATGEEDDEEESEVPVLKLQWPSAPRPALSARVYSGGDDGVQFVNWDFQNPDIQFVMPAVPGWVIAPGGAKESVALVPQRIKPAEKLSFSLYLKGEFLKQDSLEYINAYVDFLKREFGPKTEILNEGTGFRVENSFFILGANYYLVEFMAEILGKGMMHIRDYIVFLDNNKFGSIIIRYEDMKGSGGGDYVKLIESLRFSKIIGGK